MGTKAGFKPKFTTIPPQYNGRVMRLRLFRDPHVAREGRRDLVSMNLISAGIDPLNPPFLAAPQSGWQKG